MPLPQDEYIRSEPSDDKSSGLYRMGQDETGKPKVIYGEQINAEKAKETPVPKAEKCTTNTDKVDQEIETLKEEKKQLEQQITAAAGDTEKNSALKNKLAQIERELTQKNNDTYRRQQAAVS